MNPQNNTATKQVAPGVFVDPNPVVAGVATGTNGSQSLAAQIGNIQTGSQTQPQPQTAPGTPGTSTQTNGQVTYTPWTTGQPLTAAQKTQLTSAGYTFDAQGNPVAPTTGTVSSASQPNTEQGVNSVLDASGNSYSTTSPQPTYDANTVALAAAMSTNGVTVTPAQVATQYTNPDGSINTLESQTS